MAKVQIAAPAPPKEAVVTPEPIEVEPVETEPRFSATKRAVGELNPAITPRRCYHCGYVTLATEVCGVCGMR